MDQDMTERLFKYMNMTGDMCHETIKCIKKNCDQKGEDYPAWMPCMADEEKPKKEDDKGKVCGDCKRTHCMLNCDGPEGCKLECECPSQPGTYFDPHAPKPEPPK